MQRPIDYFDRRKLLLAACGCSALGVLFGQKTFGQDYTGNTNFIAFSQPTHFIPSNKTDFYPRKIITCKDLEKIRNDILKRQSPNFSASGEFDFLYETAAANFKSDFAEVQKQYTNLKTLYKNQGTPLAHLREQQAILWDLLIVTASVFLIPLAVAKGGLIAVSATIFSLGYTAYQLFSVDAGSGIPLLEVMSFSRAKNGLITILPVLSKNIIVHPMWKTLNNSILAPIQLLLGLYRILENETARRQSEIHELALKSVQNQIEVLKSLHQEILGSKAKYAAYLKETASIGAYTVEEMWKALAFNGCKATSVLAVEAAKYRYSNVLKFEKGVLKNALP